MMYTVNIETGMNPMRVIDFYDYTLREVLAKVREIVAATCDFPPLVRVYGRNNKVVYCARPRMR